MKELIAHQVKQSEIKASDINGGGLLVHCFVEMDNEILTSMVVSSNGKGYRVGYRQHKTNAIKKVVKVGTIKEVKELIKAAK